jgi:hypothetical protein
MDSGTSTRHNVDLLERVLLDGNAQPTYVPLSLLEDITNCFSDDHQIGSGGFAVVYKVTITRINLSHHNHAHHINTTTHTHAHKLMPTYIRCNCRE